jgi:RHS repeat-associated protein
VSNPYDLAGNRTSSTDGLNTTINESYDGAGRLWSVSSTPNGGQPTTLWVANNYLPVGLEQATFGDGTVESRSYDRRMRLLSSSTTNSSNQTIYSEGLSYFPNGNVQTANDLVNGNWTYTYDSLNRLGTAVSNTGEGCLYSYDAFGNRTQEAATQGGSCFSGAAFTFAGNQIQGYCYDGAGNLEDEGTCPSGNHQFFYDGYENLVSPNFNQSGRDSYTVNAFHQRVTKYVGSSISAQYLYGDDADALALMDVSGNWLQTNVRAGGMFLAELGPSGATYLHNDHLGTVRVQTGAQPETCTNLPFGEALTCNGSSDPPDYHFTGKERDTESGNDYFGSRYYASSMGRFVSPDWSDDPDPVPYADIDNPQSLNLYGYVGNNPLTATDDDGHVPCGGAAIISILVTPGGSSMSESPDDCQRDGSLAGGGIGSLPPVYNTNGPPIIAPRPRRSDNPPSAFSNWVSQQHWIPPFLAARGVSSDSAAGY